MDPRIVRFGSLEYRFRGGRLEWRVAGRAHWHVEPHTPDDFAAVAELRNHPTEDEEGAAA